MFSDMNQGMSILMALAISTLLAGVTVVASQNEPGSIIVLGDSNAEFSNDLLATNCPGRTVVNVPGETSIGGTTADNWDDSTFSNALNPDFGSGYTTAWLSVGGNDWIGPGCTSSTNDLVEQITGAAERLRAAVPGISIIMTGYCQPPDSNARDCPDKTPSTFMGPLVTALDQVAAAKDYVTFVDIGDMCGGSSSSWGDVQYFRDEVHLNNAGYNIVFSSDAVQDAFGCDGDGGGAATVGSMLTIATAMFAAV